MNNQSNLQRPLATRSFVGRERELAELRLGLEDSIAGRGRLFLVSGEPGIGKTRLAAEAASGAKEKGVKVIWGRCWEGDGVPGFWPWIQIMSTFAEADDGSGLLAKMGRKPPEASSGSLGDSDGPRRREARGLRSSRTGAELHSVPIAPRSIQLIADPHFEDALAMSTRMCARPWLAHTQEQYATMLLARRNSGDRDKAAALLDAALATAREVGMRALEERVTAAIAEMKTDLN